MLIFIYMKTLSLKIVLVCALIFLQSCEKEKDYTCKCEEYTAGSSSGALSEMMFGKKKDVEEKCNEYLDAGFTECWIE